MAYSRHDFLYWLEHEELPREFFEEEEYFLEGLMFCEGTYYECIYSIMQNVNVEAEFKPEEFTVKVCEVKEDLLAVIVTFPEPQEVYECYEAIFVINDDYSKQRYFTLERGRTVDGEGIFLCEWTRNGSHCNYGTFSLQEAREECFRIC